MGDEMRTLIATAVGVCLAGFTFSQAAQAPDPGVILFTAGVIPSTMSSDSNVEQDGVFYARGHVRIRIGATTITGDEATIRRGTGYRMRDVELSGNVHMTYQLAHD